MSRTYICADCGTYYADFTDYHYAGDDRLCLTCDRRDRIRHQADPTVSLDGAPMNVFMARYLTLTYADCLYWLQRPPDESDR